MSRHYVCVTGGRKYDDQQRVYEVVEFLSMFYGDDLRILHGNAAGLDRLVAEACYDFNVRVKPFPADWDRHGKAAGGIRNAEMADYLVWCRDTHGHSVQVLAFPGGTGTANMVACAEERGIDVDYA